MALYTEMVVGLDRKFGIAVAGLEHALRKRYTGWHAASLHFLDSERGILFKICFRKRLLLRSLG